MYFLIYQTIFLLISLEALCLAGQFDQFPLGLLQEQEELECGFGFCNVLNEIGSPPDSILFMPPPPLPPQLQHLLLINQSEAGSLPAESCNLCASLVNQETSDTEIVAPNNSIRADAESWLSILVASILGSTVFGTLLVLFLVKCKKWKIFPMSDSCPILAGGLLGGNSKSSNSCSPPSSCISPVVNEKSPQSIITNSPSKQSTIIPAKYWKSSRQMDLTGTTLVHSSGQSMNSQTIGDLSSECGACHETASCTSSPVYAELEAGSAQLVNHGGHFGSPLTVYPDVNVHTLSGRNHTQIRLSSCHTQINQYPQAHTYTEVPEAMRMARLSSQSTLLPDVSYDNAAYLPSSNLYSTGSEQNSYPQHSRSLRRSHRSHGQGSIGNTTPLLAGQSHHYSNHQQASTGLAYLTSSRAKKQRPAYMQHPLGGSKLNLSGSPSGGQLLVCGEGDGELMDLQPRYVQTAGRRLVHEIYKEPQSLGSGDVGQLHSASYRTYSYKEQPKRPLPPVPGVRL